ncbi:TetR/AcrR family transcriptional regulator [Actinoplanes sp. N902-109]|uniref:TetR/AcrR family transcriptional regulator n=1 Tax=Actinoplanes sp. (strain N902-109) TaxID=649831 RepID=UPI000329407C|nr:helix-turn-helix domain-containing protein [Actinoplanes sp. N902-109]AGL17678.1 putative transcriptional regulator [Actinoplanes sp. N902-109]
MGRQRAFDEQQAVAAAAALFARRSYDGTSVDDLVTETGVHRGSLYKTFGSKRGLYLAALRHYVDHDVAGLASGGGDARFLLLAASERAAVDDAVAAEVNRALRLLDDAFAAGTGTGTADAARERTALTLGLLLRARSGG